MTGKNKRVGPVTIMHSSV